MRAPLIEYLMFLWLDNAETTQDRQKLEELWGRLEKIGQALGNRSAFAKSMESLIRLADRHLPHFAGANGRYRFAKAVDMSDRADAVLTLAPRYENADIILNMRGVDEACAAPVYHIMLDHDWDETTWAKLRSFLYYCGGKNLM